MTRLQLILTLSAALPLAAAQAPYRAVVYDVRDLTRLRTVIDVQTKDGKIPKLAAREFRLLEDGRASATAERVIQFKETELGVELVVVLDASPSMEGRPLEAIRRGLAQLVSRKREQDRMAVLSFSDDFRWEAKWDTPAADVEKAFRELETRGRRSRLYDAVSRALDELDAAGRRDAKFLSRRAILVLSDGQDEGSQTTLDRLTDRLSDSKVRLDAVGLAGSPLWLRSLQQLAIAGFGNFRTAATPEQLTGLLDRGLDGLLATPVLEFQPETLTDDGRNHDVGVQHIATGWRDVVTVEMPDRPLYADRRVWLGTAAAVILLVFMVVMLSRGRSHNRSHAGPVVASPPPAAPPARTVHTPAPAPAASPSRVPVHRTPTMAEPVSQPIPATYAPRAAHALEPVAPPPMRVATAFAPPASQRMLLVARSGPRVGQRVEMTAPEFWIGSADNNSLCLTDDPAVSGNHACIRREGAIYRLYDNGSLNGTWVNGKATGASVVLLKDGDLITIGHSEFVFQS